MLNVACHMLPATVWDFLVCVCMLRTYIHTTL